MAEQDFGYTPRAQGMQYLNMERALRTQIIENARRQYEAASRRLRLRAQAQTQMSSRHGRVSNSSSHAYPKQDAYNPSQAYSPSFTRRLRPGAAYAPCLPSHYKTRHVPPQAYASARTAASSSSSLGSFSPVRDPITVHSAPPRVPIPTSAQAHMPVMEARAYPPSPALTSSSGRAPASASSQVPTATIFIPHDMDTRLSQTAIDDNLDVDELKRRYYAQLSGEKASSNMRERQSVMRHPTAGQHYPHNGGRGPVRTMADEYLDFYMPARRGSYSVQTQGGEPQRLVVEHVRPYIHYSPDAAHGGPRRHQNNPEYELPQIREQCEPRQRPTSANSQYPTRPESEAPSLSMSKTNLAFVLNDPVPKSYSSREHRASSSGRSSSMSNRDEEGESRPYSPNSEQRSLDALRESSPSRSNLRDHVYQETQRSSWLLRWRPPMTSDSHSPVKETDASIRTGSHENDGSLQSNSPTKSIRTPEFPTREIPLRDSETSPSPNRLRAAYSLSLKRKASTPPPQSPTSSETPSEDCVEIMPRTKRRAFNRLPIDYESESGSEPEEMKYEGGSEQSVEPNGKGILSTGEDVLN